MRDDKDSERVRIFEVGAGWTVDLPLRVRAILCATAAGLPGSCLQGNCAMQNLAIGCGKHGRGRKLLEHRFQGLVRTAAGVATHGRFSGYAEP